MLKYQVKLQMTARRIKYLGIGTIKELVNIRMVVWVLVKNSKNRNTSFCNELLHCIDLEILQKYDLYGQLRDNIGQELSLITIMHEVTKTKLYTDNGNTSKSSKCSSNGFRRRRVGFLTGPPRGRCLASTV